MKTFELGDVWFNEKDVISYVLDRPYQPVNVLGNPTFASYTYTTEAVIVEITFRDHAIRGSLQNLQVKTTTGWAKVQNPRQITRTKSGTRIIGTQGELTFLKTNGIDRVLEEMT